MTDVAIIGAGPYGLSVAAYLRKAGVQFRIFGKTMDSWKNYMPPGMSLKSHAWSSCLYDPASALTLEKFCADRSIPYSSIMLVAVETFAEYGKAFQERFAPNVENKLLTNLDVADGGFRATFDDGEVVTIRSVILAIGVHPFKYVPDALRHLPADALTHSADHGPLDRFAGKRVAVLGAGASATDLAASLHEKGAMVSLIARGSTLQFSEPTRTQRSLLKRLIYPLKPLLRPNSGIGIGWPLKIWADWPWVFHALPAAWRHYIVRTTLGPLGHSSVRDRVVGRVPLFLGRQLKSADLKEGKVSLHVASGDGSRDVIQVNHVIAATGFRIDLRQIGFLSTGLRTRIRTADDSPVLSANYECSVPGLYFVGAAAAESFGPVNRFVFGAIHPSRRLAQHLSKKTKGAPL